MLARQEKIQNLIDFSQREIDQLRNRKTSRLSSTKELSKKFRLGEHAVLSSLAEYGLRQERNIARQEFREKSVPPSREFAWLLGLISGGGSVDTSTGRIMFTEDDTGILEEFKTQGEKLFRQNSHEKTVLVQKNEKEFKQVVFNNRSLARFLGDLRKTEWPETIRDKHSWIFDDPSYLWGFFEGFFEARGTVNLKTKSIWFNTAYPEIANFLAEALARVDIRHPKIHHFPDRRRGIKGVRIGNIPDITTFAKNIHSKIPEKEARLAACREFGYKRYSSRQITNEELIAAWKELTQALGHAPRYHEIKKLRKEKRTKYSPTVYENRFGNGSFSRARGVLSREGGK